MATLQTLKIIISFGLLSCNNSEPKTAIKIENLKNDSVSADTLKSENQVTAIISDTIKRLIVDDYPVTNEMLEDKTSNNSSHPKKSGQVYSYDKAWFSNDTLKQTLVFELYTDKHRLVTYHFYSNIVPTDLINGIEFHIEGGELASEKQKLKEFNGFLKQTTKINSKYFLTNKGIRLGDTKQKVIDTYGKPDKQTKINGFEKLEWQFIGDTFYDGKTDLKGKPLAEDSFGHLIIMYFRNGKLFGQVLYNDIP